MKEFVNFVRNFSSKKYSHTVHLPKTKFPLRVEGKKRVSLELAVQHAAEFNDLYERQSRLQQRPLFILHDGPPYANGKPHVGHAINKILKDITNRYKLLKGYRVFYTAGWDCHGLPIELKALPVDNEQSKSLSPMEIRKKAKTFALEAIDEQTKAFKRWGVMANWSKSYYTFDPVYEAKQIEMFYNLFEKGLIFRDLKPVYWSPAARTALAEAELQYNDNHISESLFIKLKLKQLPVGLLQSVYGIPVFAVVWTTTPWTLPSNQALCFAKDKSYSIVCNSSNDENYLIATETIPHVQKQIGIELKPLVHIEGNELTTLTYEHPISKMEMPMFVGSHVDMEKGTGLVHTAPAHGPDDFLVATKHNLPLKCLIDEEGKFTKEAGEQLAGKSALSDGNTTVIQMLADKGMLVHHGKITHTYPYDWRSKQPVIYRASLQWFINTDLIKQTALECLESVRICPDVYKTQMEIQLAKRPHWCISRQRVWGVPIPVFYEKSTGKPIISRHSAEHVRNLVLKYGTNCWWELPESQLLPASVLEKSRFPSDTEFEKGKDVLDVWYESGLSWAAVVNGQADMYLEGLDQIRGWFQASLILAAAATGTSPYKNLVVHGFAVDEEGHKMSKSQGNIVDPVVITDGDENADSVYGADVLRWWVAAHGCNKTNITISHNLLTGIKNQVQKFRSVYRFLLGALNDYRHEVDSCAPHTCSLLDQFMLHRLLQYSLQVQMHYERFDYNKVTLETVRFLTHDVSAFYCEIIKNRLYCDERLGNSRRSCQTTLFHILDVCSRCVAPILPHLAEEIYMYHPSLKEANGSLFSCDSFGEQQSWHNEDVGRIMEPVLAIRDTFNANKGEVSSRDLDLIIFSTGQLYEKLQALQPDQVSSVSTLNEIMQTSHCKLVNKPVSVAPDDSTALVNSSVVIKDADEINKEEKYTLVISPSIDLLCERCRMYTASSDGQLCDRCSDVMQEDWS